MPLVFWFLLMFPYSDFAGSQGYPKLRDGPDPQFLPMAKNDAVSGKRFTFSNGGPRMAPCPGTQNVFSFECSLKPPPRIVDPFGINQ